MHRRELLGLLLVSLAGSLWGTAGVVGRLAMDLGYTPLDLTVYRFLLGFPVLAVAAIVIRRSLQLSGVRVTAYLFVGGIGISLSILTYFHAIDAIGVSLATILAYTAPVFTLVMSPWILEERASLTKTLAASLVVIGCFLSVKAYSPAGSPFDPIGIIAGILCGLTYSIATICLKLIDREERRPDAMVSTVYMLGFASAIIIPVGFASGLAAIEGVEALILILILALFPTALAYFLFVVGLEMSEASKANICSSLQIVTSLLLAALIIGERLDAVQVLGALLVIAGVLMTYSS